MIRVTLGCFAVILLLGTPASAAVPSPELVRDLRAGGYVLYFRHGATNWRESDDREAIARDESRLSDCTLQRNLSAEGREQARLIGAGFRKLAIPAGIVLSSPFCRCVETARIAFGSAVTVAPDLIYHVVRRRRSDAEGDAVLAALRRQLATVPPAGSNTLLVAHQGNLLAAVGTRLAEGEAAIFKPDGEGGFTLLATVRPDEWQPAAMR